MWTRVWGEQFAKERIAQESAWRASYDYAHAWDWSRSLPRAERVRLWNELLVRNGFSGNCTSLLEGPDSRDRRRDQKRNVN